MYISSLSCTKTHKYFLLFNCISFYLNMSVFMSPHPSPTNFLHFITSPLTIFTNRTAPCVCFINSTKQKYYKYLPLWVHTYGPHTCIPSTLEKTHAGDIHSFKHVFYLIILNILSFAWTYTKHQTHAQSSINTRYPFLISLHLSKHG